MVSINRYLPRLRVSKKKGTLLLYCIVLVMLEIRCDQFGIKSAVTGEVADARSLICHGLEPLPTS